MFSYTNTWFSGKCKICVFTDLTHFGSFTTKNSTFFVTFSSESTSWYIAFKTSCSQKCCGTFWETLELIKPLKRQRGLGAVSSHSWPLKPFIAASHSIECRACRISRIQSDLRVFLPSTVVLCGLQHTPTIDEGRRKSAQLGTRATDGCSLRVRRGGSDKESLELEESQRLGQWSTH